MSCWDGNFHTFQTFGGYVSDGNVAINSIDKADLCSQTFVSNLFLDESDFVLLTPLPYACQQNFSRDILSALYDLGTQEGYLPGVISPAVLKNCASVVAVYLDKLILLCLSSTTPFPAGSLLK